MRWRADFADWRERRLWQERYQADRLRQIERFCGPVAGRRVLDLGCGMGGLVVALRQAGARRGRARAEPGLRRDLRLARGALRSAAPLRHGDRRGAALCATARSTSSSASTCSNTPRAWSGRWPRSRASSPRAATPSSPPPTASSSATRTITCAASTGCPVPGPRRSIRRRGRGKERSRLRRPAGPLRDALCHLSAASSPAAARSALPPRIRASVASAPGRSASGTRFARPIALLRRLGLATLAYRAYRTFFLGTFEMHLTRSAAADATGECGGYDGG